MSFLFICVPIIFLFIALYSMLTYASRLHVVNSFKKNKALSEDGAKTLEMLGLEDRMNAPALNYYIGLIEKSCIKILRGEMPEETEADVEPDEPEAEPKPEPEFEGVEYIPEQRPEGEQTPPLADKFWLDEREFVKHDYNLAWKGFIALFLLLFLISFSYWLILILL